MNLADLHTHTNFSDGELSPVEIINEALNNKIKYLSIPRLVEKTLNKASFSNINSIKDVLEIDNDARQTARSMVISGKY